MAESTELNEFESETPILPSDFFQIIRDHILTILKGRKDVEDIRMSGKNVIINKIYEKVSAAASLGELNYIALNLDNNSSQQLHKHTGNFATLANLFGRFSHNPGSEEDVNRCTKIAADAWLVDKNIETIKTAIEKILEIIPKGALKRGDLERDIALYNADHHGWNNWQQRLHYYSLHQLELEVETSNLLDESTRTKCLEAIASVTTKPYRQFVVANNITEVTSGPKAQRPAFL